MDRPVYELIQKLLPNTKERAQLFIDPLMNELTREELPFMDHRKIDEMLSLIHETDIIGIYVPGGRLNYNKAKNVDVVSGRVIRNPKTEMAKRLDEMMGNHDLLDVYTKDTVTIGLTKKDHRIYKLSREDEQEDFSIDKVFEYPHTSKYRTIHLSTCPYYGYEKLWGHVSGKLDSLSGQE